MRPIAAFHRTGSPWLPTLAVFTLALVAHTLGLADDLDGRVHDHFLRLVPKRVPEPAAALPDVAVVTIDPRSLRALEDWPWPRRIYATAIERLD